MDFKPPKTVRDFMRSEALVKTIIGPLGSGKSAGALFELFRRMCQQEPDKNGVRPTRMVIVRNTSNQLRETTLSDAKSYFGEYFTHKVSTQTLEFRFELGDGTTVQSDWLLMPLERPEDQRKLLSLNITAAMIDECREVPYSIVAAVLGRIGRYPAKKIVKPTWQALIMVSNPWSESSDYHTNFVIDRPEGWDFFHQPGGMDVGAENREYLPDGYYERLLQGQSDEWVNVHVHSMFGEDQFGQAVYKAVFRADRHIRDGLIHNPMVPLLLGMDFGRTPCAIITQEDYKGRMLCLEELTSEDMGLHAFISNMLVPHMLEFYPDCRIFIVGDPAGQWKGQFTEDSAFSVLGDAGLKAIPAPTNEPKARIQAVEKRLLQNAGDTADFLIDSEKCPILKEGFLRGYRYKKQKSGMLTPVPEKNEFSHPHDGLQYAALGHQSAFVGKRLTKYLREGVKRFATPNVTARSWT